MQKMKIRFCVSFLCQIVLFYCRVKGISAYITQNVLLDFRRVNFHQVCTCARQNFAFESLQAQAQPEISVPLRNMYSDSNYIKKQRESLNHVQVNRELVYGAIKRKIRASSYDYGTQNINRFFVQFDLDRDGLLDLDEFRKIMRQLGIQEDKLSSEEVRIVWEEMNSEREEGVSVHQFMNWLESSDKYYMRDLRPETEGSSQSAWTYGEGLLSSTSNPSYTSNAKDQTVASTLTTSEDYLPLNSVSFITSLVDSCEKRVYEVSYFLMTEIGIPRDKLASIALKAPEIFNLDIEKSLRPLLNDMLDLGVQPHKLAKMVQSFPALLSTSQERRRMAVSSLEYLGLSPNAIGKCFCMHPQLLSLSVQEKILPTVKFLELEGGIPKTGVRKVITCVPSVLGLSIQHNLGPKFEYFKNELHLSQHKTGAMVMKFPQVLCLSLSNNIRPTISFLTDELGVAFCDTGKIVHQNPQLLGLNVAVNLRGKVAYLVEELGVPREHLGRVICMFPTLLSLSHENNLRPKVSFLTKEAGFSLDEIVKAPHLLAYSLEQRIKPRCAIMIRSGVRMALASLLSPSDEVFYRKYGSA